MRVMMPGEEVPADLLADIQTAIDDVEMGGTPGLLEEGTGLLRHFYETVRRLPHEFQEGKAFNAIAILDRTLARRGVALEQLGTSRKKVFSEVMRIVRTA